MPKYVRVPATAVDSELRDGVHGIVLRALPELDLGAEPEIGWFADARSLTAEQVRAAREVCIPGDGVPKAGNVPPFVSYTAARGWVPARPLILLNRDACPPDTALHELRHLWQIKAGRYRADEYATHVLEDDADAWGADAMVRLGISPTGTPRSK